jgi:hypothetical protein
LQTGPAGNLTRYVLDVDLNDDSLIVQDRTGTAILRIGTPYGATATRPTTTLIGTVFFDSTLGIPIWWNGTGWVNASGAVA